MNHFEIVQSFFRNQMKKINIISNWKPVEVLRIKKYTFRQMFQIFGFRLQENILATIEVDGFDK